MTTHDLKETVRQRYAEAARQATSGAQSGCCSPTCCGGIAEGDPITSSLYSEAETASLPKEAVSASLGCGNPTALAELQEGEVVLDLGSGGGIDVLLSARRVGPSGKAFGLDMTDDMLALAHENQRKAGAENVEFLKGEIEAIPLPDSSVDVIISNCVVNLSGDKQKVIEEAFRVLKPGGRFAVSDVVIRGDVPPQVRQSMELWVGCVAGALTDQEFHSLLWQAGFEQIGIEPTRIYEFEDAKAFLRGTGLDTELLARELGGRVMGAFIRARKPGGRGGDVSSKTVSERGCVSVRTAQGEDLPAITRLLQESGLPTSGVQEWLSRFLVAEHEGKVVAVAGMELYGPSALLRSVGVRPEWRGSGLGRHLVDRLLMEARERGTHDVYLLTTTAEDYFPRFGFACISRDQVPQEVKGSVEFTWACCASAVVMRKSLPTE